jgi:site-specific recombinase XerD
MHQQGVDLATIKTILRHTREETTNIYAHVQDDTRQAAAAKMSAVMEALGDGPS